MIILKLLLLAMIAFVTVDFLIDTARLFKRKVMGE